MREFFRNLFQALFGIITWPFRMLGFGGGGGSAAARQAAESDEADSRVEAVQAAVAPQPGLEDAMSVRRAARCLLRGDAPEGVDMPVRRWLDTLGPVGLAFVARAQPDVLARVLAGQESNACPVPPFVRSECDGSAVVAKLKADLMAARAGGHGAGPQPVPQPRLLPFGQSLSRTIRTAAANRP